MSTHLINGEFQSDKYPTCPRGKVPLSVKDKSAQDLLWLYAQRRRSIDAEFSDDLVEALRIAGWQPPQDDPNEIFLDKRLASDLVLATRLLRRAVTELECHISYLGQDEETREFLERQKEG